MTKLLFVEDEPESVATVESLIRARKLNYDCKIVGFDDFEDTMKSFNPDIVVLDLLKGKSQAVQETVGLDLENFIWEKQFCPILIYSAKPDIYDEKKRDNHPFIKSVQKGSGSEKEVLDKISEFQPHVDALREAQQDVRQAFSIVMRDVAPLFFRSFDNATKRKDAIKRSGRRRLAALMDQLPYDGNKLLGWEQYLIPPVSEDIQLGDILRISNANFDDPNAFRVVLSPSCDLVASGGRIPKVDSVLVAQCCSINLALDLIQLHPPKKIGSSIKKQSYKEKLTKSLLSQGFSKSIILFPGLENRIPEMAANLRKLELIPHKEINNNGDLKYVRVASIDSPFRELVSWAYLQIACRPGLPERDFDNWAEEIIEQCQ